MSSQIVDFNPAAAQAETHNEKPVDAQQEFAVDEEKKMVPNPPRQDAFGDEEFAEVKYKVLKWW